MNIINKLTIRYLKQNKKRTIFTILSIILSIIMINSIGISLYSAQTFYKKIIEKETGTFHYQIVTNNKEVFDYIKKDNEIEEYFLSNTKQYTLEENNISLKRADETYYNQRNINDLIIKGSLPTSPDEIAITEEYHQNIGDTIILTDENNNYQFKVVGIINRYSSSSHYDRDYQAISYIDLNNTQDYYSIFVKDKEVSKNIFVHAESIRNKFEGIELNYNSSYLGIQNVFEDGSNSTMLVVYKLVAVLLLIIMIASVLIIYQSFNLSTNEKVQYLGMLSSVGATPRQKKLSVFFEGMILTLISLPLGLLISYLGLYVTFHFINQFDVVKETGVSIKALVSLKYSLIVIILSIITVAISLIVPAIKLSKISVLDALRKNDEIKVKAKKLRIKPINKKIFNFNKQLAIKNYKRQGRRSKVIIGSLALSMILFISIMSFSKSMRLNIFNSRYYNQYDIVAAPQTNEQELIQELNNNDKVEGYYYCSSAYITGDVDKSYFKNSVDEDVIDELYLTILDDENYKKLCEHNNVEYQDNQLLVYDLLVDGKVCEYSKMDKDFIKNIKYPISENKEINIAGMNSIEHINNDTYTYNEKLHFVISKSLFDKLCSEEVLEYTFYIKSKQHKELAEELEKLGYYSYDETQNNIIQEQLLLISQIFVYGFIIIMIIFSTLNIINMMNASIDKRQKEFAMLLSVGMSPIDIKKMILNESLIYGIKSMIYALPISLLIEYILYIFVKDTNKSLVFKPYIAVYILSFLFIMGVMILTFKISLSRFNKQNIIETLKDDM